MQITHCQRQRRGQRRGVVGIAPYGNGLDFLDWMKDFLDGKVI